MKVKGNIRQIKQKRDSSNQEVELHLDKVEYVTYKKDGKYDQAFDFVDELDSPLVLTGDCLALAPTKQAAEDEYEYLVFEKVGDAYELNENKHLTVTLTYDFDADVTILSAASYVVTVSNEELKNIKTDRHQARRKQNRGKSRKNTPRGEWE